MIYLRFITERWSLESRLIRYGTRWWPSHVEFIDDSDGMTLGSRVNGGVKVRPCNYCKPSREEWWTAPGIDAAYAMAKMVVGYQYDWMDIIGFIFARDWHHSGNFICSELVDWAFKQTGNGLTNSYMSSNRVSPRDLMVSPILKIVKVVKSG